LWGFLLAARLFSVVTGSRLGFSDPKVVVGISTLPILPRGQSAAKAIRFSDPKVVVGISTVGV
jgi:hypothetical protein